MDTILEDTAKLDYSLLDSRNARLYSSRAGCKTRFAHGCTRDDVGRRRPKRPGVTSGTESFLGEGEKNAKGCGIKGVTNQALYNVLHPFSPCLSNPPLKGSRTCA